VLLLLLLRDSEDVGLDFVLAIRHTENEAYFRAD